MKCFIIMALLNIVLFIHFCNILPIIFWTCNRDTFYFYIQCHYIKLQRLPKIYVLFLTQWKIFPSYDYIKKVQCNGSFTPACTLIQVSASAHCVGMVICVVTKQGTAYPLNCIEMSQNNIPLTSMHPSRVALLLLPRINLRKNTIVLMIKF